MNFIITILLCLFQLSFQPLIASKTTYIFKKNALLEVEMPTIAYFISDHGLGHASRSVAIIRELLECDLEISINVHTSNPLNFVKKSLAIHNESKRVDFHKQMNDMGFIYDQNTRKIDYQQTVSEIHTWINDWDCNYLFNEYRYLKAREIDLIVSDIAPQPFLLAKKLKIPSIAISNFTWYDTYQNLDINLDDLETLWRAYREASLGLMLPFNLENMVFQSIFETSLVSRNPMRSKAHMYDLLAIEPSKEVIYAGTGISIDNPFLQEWIEEPNTVFILGSQSKIRGENVRSVPSNDTEGQDYIACSDIALIKLGYSSISEAIRSHVPIIGIDFVQTAETKEMVRKIQELGIGICISTEEYYRGKWLEYIPDVLDMQQNFSHLPDRFHKRGELEITNILLDLLEEII
ncbi:MAG: glycosyltransferase family protein [Candidatus Hodarchaeota archaeon]